MKRIKSSTDDPYRILNYAAEESSFTGRARFDPREIATIDLQAVPPLHISHYTFEKSTATLAAIDAAGRVWIWYPALSTWVTAA